MWVALDWVEHHCVIPDGFRKGQPFRLYVYQGQYLREFYRVKAEAVWEPGNPQLASAFTFRRGLLVGPQKIGKNPLIAAQVCLEFVGPALFAGWADKGDVYACADHGCRCGWEYPYQPGDAKGMPWPTPKIQITAFSEDSTENTYDALRPMISQGPLADVLPKVGEEFIRHPNGAEDSRIDTVTSSNQSRLGQRVTFVPQDELGLWTPQNKMTKLADTQYRGLAGMGGRASLTTNAWDPADNSVAQREFESAAQDVYRQFIEPPKNLSYGDKRERHKIHQFVYGTDTVREAGGHVDLANIEAEAADLVAKDPAQAERFFGNRRVVGAGHAIDADRWDELAAPREVTAGTYIALGFDGSDSDDSAFLRGCTADGYRFTIESWVKPTGDALTAYTAEHPGRRWTVNRASVDAAVHRAFRDFHVGRMYFDPWGWRHEGDQWADEFGEDIVAEFPVNQPRRFASCVDRWTTVNREGTHPHDGDPVCAAQVKATHLRKLGAAEAEENGLTQYILVKGPDKRKIDGAIADALAVEAAADMPEESVSVPMVAWA